MAAACFAVAIIGRGDKHGLGLRGRGEGSGYQHDSLPLARIETDTRPASGDADCLLQVMAGSGAAKITCSRGDPQFVLLVVDAFQLFIRKKTNWLESDYFAWP